MGGLRQPIWWPAAALALILAAGLIVLAVQPGARGGLVVIYGPEERPSPVPLDPEASRLVDLNRATRAELEALPGIGEARAGAIMEARAVRPLRSLAEAVERGVLPRAVAVGLRDWASARP